MQVEILGVLKGARGPGHDMILAQLHGTKPEYTGVVAGMSGSPVYIGDKLLGSLSYRIGQFSKDPIAGITPIAQMLEVRDIPVGDQTLLAALPRKKDTGPMGEEAAFVPMEHPQLVMSGFHPEAVKLWQQKMEGTGLETVSAGGGTSKTGKLSSAAAASIVPGSAVSALLVAGDLEIAATCTVTCFMSIPNSFLACGHPDPAGRAKPVSLPMTSAEVLWPRWPRRAERLQDRQYRGDDRRIHGGSRCGHSRSAGCDRAHMIPVHIAVHSGGKTRNLNIQVLDLPALTSQAMLVSLCDALLETNESTADSSYHVTGSIDVDGYAPATVDAWTGGAEGLASTRLGRGPSRGRSASRSSISNETRMGAIRGVTLNVESIPRHRTSVDLTSARFTSGNIVHFAGDTVTVEATLRPWQQAEKNVRISFRVPARLQGGNVRVLISDAGTLDRTMSQPKLMPRPVDMQTAIAEARNQHAQDRAYVSLLVPETQAGMQGQTLSSVPISMANALEPMRTAQDVTLNGESAQLAAEGPAGGVLTGFQVLNLRIEPGGGVD